MFSDSSQKKCVTVHINGIFDNGKGTLHLIVVETGLISLIIIQCVVIYIEPEWTFLDLLSAASLRVDIVPAARRVFNANGNWSELYFPIHLHLKACIACRS